jgi:hypothetical protein
MLRLKAENLLIVINHLINQIWLGLKNPYSLGLRLFFFRLQVAQEATTLR